MPTTTSADEDESAVVIEDASDGDADDAPGYTGPAEDNDADDGYANGDHVSWALPIGASYRTGHTGNGSSSRKCGDIRSMHGKGDKRTARIDTHDASHTPTGRMEDHATRSLKREDSLTGAVKESAMDNATVPVVDAPDAARRAGAAIPEQMTGAIVREAGLEQQYPNRRRMVIMEAKTGNARFKNRYTEQALQALVGEVQRRKKGFWGHAPVDAIMRGDERSLKDLACVAVRETVHYDPVAKQVRADVECTPMALQSIDLAHAAGDTIGVSVEAVGKRASPGSSDIVGWLNYQGFCLVPEGGAGGMTVREADTPALIHEEHDFAMGLLDNLTPQEVKDANAPLWEAVGKEYAASKNLIDEATARMAVARESVMTMPPTTIDVEAAIKESPAIQAIIREAEALRAEKDTLATQNAELAGTVDEMLAAENRRLVTAHVEKVVRESNPAFTDKQVSFVMRSFEGATMGERGTYTAQEDLEAAVTREADAYAETLPPTAAPVKEEATVTPATPKKGQLTGLGGGLAAPTAESNAGTAAVVVPKSEDAGATVAEGGYTAPTAPKTTNDLVLSWMEGLMGGSPVQ